MRLDVADVNAILRAQIAAAEAQDFQNAGAEIAAERERADKADAAGLASRLTHRRPRPPQSLCDAPRRGRTRLKRTPGLVPGGHSSAFGSQQGRLRQQTALHLSWTPSGRRRASEADR
jgi:hypothetical protein